MSTEPSPTAAGSVTVREYVPTDEQDWLRCRVLGFLNTAYFDDVVTQKPSYEASTIELVADSAGIVVGVMDVAVRGENATIETVALHPDFARRGIGSLLLAEAERRLPSSVTALDAWTRDDESANAWYVAHGFQENFRYVHVYATGDREQASAIVQAGAGLTPIAAFFHAASSAEEEMRATYSRVYICRQYVRSVSRP